MNKINNILVSLILLFIVAAGSYIGINRVVRTVKSNNLPKNTVSISTLKKIPKDSIVLGDYTLFCDQEYCGMNVFHNKLEERVANIRINGYTKSINILVSSGGGVVELGVKLGNLFKLAIKKGYSINCYISKAMSAAFFVIQACSKRIGLKGSLYMTHPVYYYINGGKEYTTETRFSDLKLCEIEGKRIKSKNWCASSRNEEKDRYYTDKEALRLNLIDEILE